MDLELKVKNGVVRIIGDAEREMYSLKVANLGDLLEETGIQYSKWIHNLLWKAWITPEFLYRFAVLIKKYNPRNKIDWESTFFMVENKRLMDQEYQPSQNPGTSLFDKALNRIEFKRDYAAEDFNEQVKRETRANLVKYGLA